MGKHDRGSRALVALALLCLSPACKQPRGTQPAPPVAPPALGAVRARPIPPLELRGWRIELDAERLAKRVGERLSQDGIFAGGAQKGGTAEVTLEALPLAGDSAEDAVRVKLRLRVALRPEGAAPAHFAEDAVALGEAPLEAKTADEARAGFQRLTERTADDLVALYVARQRLWQAAAPAIVEALGAPDLESRVEAVRVVAARQLRQAIPKLLTMLEDEDEGVRDAALGALVVLRERGAVKVLAKSRQMRDAREMRKILDAMGTLGGREAKDYLGFVAETHDDEEIREMATSALERMTRNAEKSTK